MKKELLLSLLLKMVRSLVITRLMNGITWRTELCQGKINGYLYMMVVLQYVTIILIQLSNGLIIMRMKYMRVTLSLGKK